MAAAPSALGSRSRRPAVLVVAALTQALVGFDLFAVTVALPKMAVDLGATTIDLSWVVGGFAIGLAGCVIPGGRLGERFGYRRMLVGGLGVFGVGALLAGMATTPTAVVVARVVQ
uniref:MFS transporter n=1 Tax=Rhabdothermincola sp. TaxID=2820405 RepID=UPI002FE2B04C